MTRKKSRKKGYRSTETFEKEMDLCIYTSIDALMSICQYPSGTNNHHVQVTQLILFQTLYDSSTHHNVIQSTMLSHTAKAYLCLLQCILCPWIFAIFKCKVQRIALCSLVTCLPLQLATTKTALSYTTYHVTCCCISTICAPSACFKAGHFKNDIWS